jgi:hypothetical protein
VLVPAGMALHDQALVAWGEESAVYADAVAARWRTDTAALQWQLKDADRTIAQLAEPPPFFERPGTIRGLYTLRDTAILAAVLYVAARGLDAQ